MLFYLIKSIGLNVSLNDIQDKFNIFKLNATSNKLRKMKVLLKRYIFEKAIL